MGCGGRGVYQHVPKTLLKSKTSLLLPGCRCVSLLASGHSIVGAENTDEALLFAAATPRVISASVQSAQVPELSHCFQSGLMQHDNRLCSMNCSISAGSQHLDCPLQETGTGHCLCHPID